MGPAARKRGQRPFQEKLNIRLGLGLGEGARQVPGAGTSLSALLPLLPVPKTPFRLSKGCPRLAAMLGGQPGPSALGDKR